MNIFHIINIFMYFVLLFSAVNAGRHNAFVKAIIRKDWKTVLTVLEWDIKLMKPDIDMNVTLEELGDVTPLMCAIVCGQLKVVEALVKAGANVGSFLNNKDKFDIARRMERSTNEALMGHDHIEHTFDKETFTDFGITVGSNAKKLAMVKEVVSDSIAAANGVEVGMWIRGVGGAVITKKDCLALIESKKESVILEFCNKRYVRHETFVKIISFLESNEQQLVRDLMDAATNGKIDIVQELIRKGVDVTAVDNDRKTAYIHAAQNCRTNVIDVLGKCFTASDPMMGDIIDRQDKEGKTALMYAAEIGHSATVQALLNAAADMNEASNKDGRTALMIAAQHGHFAVFKTLFEAESSYKHGDRTDIKAKDNNGKTALDYARAWQPKISALPAIAEAGGVAGLAAVAAELKDADTRRQFGQIIDMLKAKDADVRRRLLGYLPVSTLLVLGVTCSLLLLCYLVCQFKRRLTTKRQPANTDLPTDLESGLTDLSETL